MLGLFMNYICIMNHNIFYSSIQSIEMKVVLQFWCNNTLKKLNLDYHKVIQYSGYHKTIFSECNWCMTSIISTFTYRYSHGVSSPGRHVRTRLYFTSESHVHSLLTVLRFGGLLDVSI